MGFGEVEAEYSRKSDFSKAEVVREQISLCNKTRSKEMKKGYFNYTPDGKKVYIPDSRKEWISSVKALMRLLTPEIRQSPKIKKRIKELLKKEKDLFEEYSYIPSKKVYDKNGRIVWKKIENARPYIPEVDEEVIGDNPKKPQTLFVSRIPGLWNDKVCRYWDSLVELYDEIFSELNVLIDAKNYFKQKVNYGFDIDDDEDEDFDEEEDEEE